MSLFLARTIRLPESGYFQCVGREHQEVREMRACLLKQCPVGEGQSKRERLKGIPFVRGSLNITPQC